MDSTAKDSYIAAVSRTEHPASYYEYLYYLPARIRSRVHTPLDPTKKKLLIREIRFAGSNEVAILVTDVDEVKQADDFNKRLADLVFVHSDREDCTNFVCAVRDLYKEFDIPEIRVSAFFANESVYGTKEYDDLVHDVIEHTKQTNIRYCELLNKDTTKESGLSLIKFGDGTMDFAIFVPNVLITDSYRKIDWAKVIYNNLVAKHGPVLTEENIGNTHVRSALMTELEGQPVGNIVELMWDVYKKEARTDYATAHAENDLYIDRMRNFEKHIMEDNKKKAGAVSKLHIETANNDKTIALMQDSADGCVNLIEFVLGKDSNKETVIHGRVLLSDKNFVYTKFGVDAIGWDNFQSRMLESGRQAYEIVKKTTDSKKIGSELAHLLCPSGTSWAALYVVPGPKDKPHYETDFPRNGVTKAGVSATGTSDAKISENVDVINSFKDKHDVMVEDLKKVAGNISASLQGSQKSSESLEDFLKIPHEKPEDLVSFKDIGDVRVWTIKLGNDLVVAAVSTTYTSSNIPDFKKHVYKHASWYRDNLHGGVSSCNDIFARGITGLYESYRIKPLSFQGAIYDLTAWPSDHLAAEVMKLVKNVPQTSPVKEEVTKSVKSVKKNKMHDERKSIGAKDLKAKIDGMRKKKLLEEETDDSCENADLEKALAYLNEDSEDIVEDDAVEKVCDDADTHEYEENVSYARVSAKKPKNLIPIHIRISRTDDDSYEGFRAAYFTVHYKLNIADKPQSVKIGVSTTSQNKIVLSADDIGSALHAYVHDLGKETCLAGEHDYANLDKILRRYTFTENKYAPANAASCDPRSPGRLRKIFDKKNFDHSKTDFAVIDYNVMHTREQGRAEASDYIVDTYDFSGMDFSGGKRMYDVQDFSLSIVHHKDSNVPEDPLHGAIDSGKIRMEDIIKQCILLDVKKGNPLTIKENSNKASFLKSMVENALGVPAEYFWCSVLNRDEKEEDRNLGVKSFEQKLAFGMMSQHRREAREMNALLGSDSQHQLNAFQGEGSPTLEKKPLVSDSVKMELLESGYRVAAKQFVELTSAPLVAALLHNLGDDSPEMRAKLARFFESALGKDIVAGILSTGLMFLPENPHASILSQELRVQAMTNLGDRAVDLFMGPLRQVVADQLRGSMKNNENILPDGHENSLTEELRAEVKVH